MIPINLRVAGFLSYHEPVEVDFYPFDLACISGQNGAGKSSLLDAMTWAVFGQARKRDESLINMQSTTAKVEFIFEYENNHYRIIRSLSRGKSTMLEFQILDQNRSSTQHQESTVLTGDWRPLTLHNLRETQALIEKILRLDYDTFINVSFFLQGRADLFAQQPPIKRKEILGDILGLEIWEAYRNRCSEFRRNEESKLALVENHIVEINTELEEERPRKVHLKGLEEQLESLVANRKSLQADLTIAKQEKAGLDKHREMVNRLAQGLERSQLNLSRFQSRLTELQEERQPHLAIVKRAVEIEAAYAKWLQAREGLERWNSTASQFHEQEKYRFQLLNEIDTQKARLEQERVTLEKESLLVRQQLDTSNELENELDNTRKNLNAAEENLSKRELLEKKAQAMREQQVEFRTENSRLKVEMDELDQRIKKLEATEGVTCPLCGQPLSQEHRQKTLRQLRTEGRQKGDTWRGNKIALDELDTQLADFEKQISGLMSGDADRLRLSNNLSQLIVRVKNIQERKVEWETKGGKRLEEIIPILEMGGFAVEERMKLTLVDKNLSALGYDVAAHDEARQIELQARPAEHEYRSLESSRAALKPIEDEITNLRSQMKSLTSEISNQRAEYQVVLETLSNLELQAPDLETVEHNLSEAQERENQFNQEVGAARQKVAVLAELKKRKKKLGTEREKLSLLIDHYKTLERAFGKDGVPALLIEQAIPQMEMKANEILGRLSDDNMRIRFETQTRYKDEKRKDLRETLEIRVSDGIGERDYELYSGGEAFRVNFAIRLALSEVLAQRKGARLQMLVIDEGFGSQDTQGRQRLIEAINAVRGDFAKILVITHLDELKDVFPTRIEVEKTDRGSTVTVLS